MRRILYYSLLCFLWVSVNSCSNEDASTPPPPTIKVDKTSGLLSDDEFTFEVEQVGAGSISLLPYGVDNPSFGGVLISASQFQDGKAIVKFKYAHVGTFQAVAASTNHSGDGSSVKTSYSSAVTITIESDKATMSDFSFDGSTNTAVTPGDDNVADHHDVTITIPWSKHNDIGKLKLRYSTAAEAKVTIGSTPQESDKTENNFASPQTYTVTSQNGDKTRTYTVSVVQTPAETNTNFKSLNAIITNKGKLNFTDAAYAKKQLKVATGRVLPGYVDNAAKAIVVYDTLNVDPTVYDSLALDWALDGKFSNVKYHENNVWGKNGKKHTAGERVKGKDTVNLKGADMPLELEVTPEDSTVTLREVYEIYVAQAPKLHVATTNLIPNKGGASNENFAANIDVIGDTDTEHLNLSITLDVPAGSSIVSVSIVQDNNGMPTVVGAGAGPWTAANVNVKKPIKVLVTVDAPGSTPDFVVTYTVSTTVK